MDQIPKEEGNASSGGRRGRPFYHFEKKSYPTAARGPSGIKKAVGNRKKRGGETLPPLKGERRHTKSDKSGGKGSGKKRKQGKETIPRKRKREEEARYLRAREGGEGCRGFSPGGSARQRKGPRRATIYKRGRRGSLPREEGKMGENSVYGTRRT